LEPEWCQLLLLVCLDFLIFEFGCCTAQEGRVFEKDGPKKRDGALNCEAGITKANLSGLRIHCEVLVDHYDEDFFFCPLEPYAVTYPFQYDPISIGRKRVRWSKFFL